MTKINVHSDGKDFVAMNEIFMLSPGQTELQVPINLMDDIFSEDEELFEVLFSTSPGVFIDTPARTTVSILDDDTLPGIIYRFTGCCLLNKHYFWCYNNTTYFVNTRMIVIIMECENVHNLTYSY